MKLNILLKKHLKKILVIVLLLLALLVSLYLVKQRQDIRNRAAGNGVIRVYLDPPNASITSGGSAVVKVMLRNSTTTGVSINLGTVDTQINLSDLSVTQIECNTNLFPFGVFYELQNNKILLTCAKRLGNQYPPVQIPVGATVELGHFTISPNTGAQQSSISVVNTLIPDLTTSTDLSDAGTGGTYTFTGSSTTPTPTSTGVPTPTLTPTGSITPTATPTGSITPTATPTGSITPTVSPTGSISPSPSLTPTITLTPVPSVTLVVSLTPTISPTPSATPVPTITLSPTPPSGQEAYTIDIGTKSVLNINIGDGNTPQIKFSAKLAGAEGHPDMYIKLRAKDDLAFLNNPNSGPTCESPGVGGVDLYVPVKADNSGIYKPVTSINVPSPVGGTVAVVDADGWVSLAGLSSGKYYTLNLKGPKTRGTQMLEHVLLAGGQDQNQVYDWTDNNLQPGDLPDPNNSSKQDCAVNSVDISLIISRLGKTDVESLNIADVSYDGVVNANDIAQVVGTLSTKPDDDN